MKVSRTKLPEVLLIEPKVFGDSRGFFCETYHQGRYAEAGIPQRFVQDNLSRSVKGTLRGLHYQDPFPQGKLVQVLAGAVYDVVVDIRRGSPTFRQWLSITLSDENKYQLWIPPGFAHGFYVLSESADFFYKCTEFYSPENERGIRWNDPTLNIEWPSRAPLISVKDSAAPSLNDAPVLPKFGQKI